MSKIYQVNSGVVITLDMAQDLSAATVTEVRYLDPKGKRGRFAATVVESTKLRYTTADGELGRKGTWKFNAYAETPTWKGLGDTVSFEVSDEFE